MQCSAVVLENVITAIRVRIRFNETLGSELGRSVDGMCKLALEQLEEDGHPGWSVLDWEACYFNNLFFGYPDNILINNKVAQVSLAIGLGPSA